MRGATPEIGFGENQADSEYHEDDVEMSKEQVFAEVVRMVQERARLRDRKYPSDARWKRIVPGASCICPAETRKLINGTLHFVRAIDR